MDIWWPKVISRLTFDGHKTPQTSHVFWSSLKSIMSTRNLRTIGKFKKSIVKETYSSVVLLESILIKWTEVNGDRLEYLF